jgi:hypothetical protein
LAQTTALTNLTSLNFSGCGIARARADAGPSQCEQGPKDSNGLVSLLSSPVVKNLTHLNLGYAGITDPLVYTTIATTPHLSNLVSLELSANRISSAAVVALAASTTLINITHLNLFWNALGDELIAQLFSPPSLLATKLQALNLGHTNITVSSLQVLSQASPHLTELILNGNDKLGPEGAAFIAAHMPNLTKLDLAFCNIEDEGYTALAASTALTNLCELNLNGNKPRVESVIALMESHALVSLTDLDLTNTHNGPNVLIAVVQSPSMSKLQRLKCGQNVLGDVGVIALAQSTTLQNLTRLDLYKTGIGSDGVKALCTSPVVSKLAYLRLDSNPVGNSIAEALAAPSSTLYSLVELSLEGVNMDDEGVLQLLTTPNLDQLNVLGVRGSATSNIIKDLYRSRFDGEISFLSLFPGM